jgi:hypothetical protein
MYGELVPSPDQVRARLSPEHALMSSAGFGFDCPALLQVKMSQRGNNLCHEVQTLVFRCEQYGIDQAFRHSRDHFGEVCVSRFKVLLNQVIDIAMQAI